MKINFSPPDITDLEVKNVIETLGSGWITTGPKTKLFERQIADYCGTKRAVCLNSATAALELTLRILGIGVGDEVITSAYTYTASASVINHVGAKIILCDIQQDSFEMDYIQLERLITTKTKAIIPVDLAGKLCDYDMIFDIVNRKKNLFNATNDLQRVFSRIIILADAAHSFGARKCKYKYGKKETLISGVIADFTAFSFHAVKNLTTAEGGAVTWRDVDGMDNELIYKQFMLWSLHGQNKDALAKTQIGSWEYDIKILGQKCNMTDIAASIGIAQLQRYEDILDRRHKIIDMYDNSLKGKYITSMEHYNDNSLSSGHLYITRVPNINLEQRNNIIIKMADKGIATNVHYKPLPMHSAYKELGFDIVYYPNAYSAFANEITLPLHTLLTDEEVEYVIDSYISSIGEMICK